MAAIKMLRLMLSKSLLAVFHQGAFHRSHIPGVYCFGGGLRYFIDLEHHSSIRLEYGFGEKRPGEKRQGGFYLALSEAF